MNSEEFIVSNIKQEPGDIIEQTIRIQDELRNDDSFIYTEPGELVTCKLENDNSIEIKEETITSSDEEHEEPCYTCGNCNYETEDHRSFKLHVNTCSAHPLDKPIRDFRCNVCFKSFTSESRFSGHFRQHLNGTSNKRIQKADRYKCKICHKEFPFRHGLKNHLTIHTGEKKYRCTMCPKVFRTSSARCQHISKHLLDEKASALPEMRARPKRSSDKKPSVENMNDLKKKYKCPICLKRFRSAKYLAVHKAIHSMRRRYKCKTCERAFRWHSSLKCHKETHDRKIKNENDDVRKMKKRNDDDKENKSIIKNESRVECEICHKTYAHKLTLRQHMVVHDEDKLFECSLCHNKFTRSASLKYHYTTQHLQPCRETIDRPFECSLCPKRYGQSSHLNRHLKSHDVDSRGTRAECGLCEKTFTQRWSLKRHMSSAHDTDE